MIARLVREGDGNVKPQWFVNRDTPLRDLARFVDELPVPVAVFYREELYSFATAGERQAWVRGLLLGLGED